MLWLFQVYFFTDQEDTRMNESLGENSLTAMVILNKEKLNVSLMSCSMLQL